MSIGHASWDGPRGPHDTEQRWAHARRLLHDDTLQTGDRVAGLLLVLYAQRLSTIGIRPQRVRSTVLFTLATELPAAIIARMLGIHVKVVVAWQRAAAGDWAAYAAEVSRRRSAKEHRP